MVDVSGKKVTRRTAVAESRVLLPAAVAKTLRESDGRSKKGPVFDTAVIAGVMAAKRTHELIPFCHPMAIDDCRIHIDMEGDEIVILCQVSIEHRTGVEMEALTGASIAALTIYDMCKALSHEIAISSTRLLLKRGGKSDFDALANKDVG
ncbi:MAG: cyclic pyranopterin monophosphate synthase MoaC [Gammaproteobacteria bacterium]|nr:cyclic pyranopterin monophosphate synthase MoaC [Gammaproteobacteria bacterium]